ncbi:hypothetical protein EI200_11795 [Peribacillus simplex]|uniref:hypothetical protein n=1 Tax=Peribacillus simplex TaxID=1478 RepID=UPI000F637CED|nr:hypothetical protein [Peribacillus simplex]RRN71131.1 hypothetical protein EI200_11795 [Peribacillus simplex]
MSLITNAPIIVEAIEKELRGKRFIAFNIYRHGVDQGSQIHEIELEGDLFVKVLDALNSVGAQQAEIVTDSQAILKALFNVGGFNAVFKRDAEIYRSLYRYFEEGNEYHKIIEELYFNGEPEEQPHEVTKGASHLSQILYSLRALLNRLKKQKETN